MNQAERLKKIRIEIAKLSQTDFAKTLSVSKEIKGSVIKNVEAQSQNITIELAALIELVYNINSRWLLLGKGFMFLRKTDLIKNNNPNEIIKFNDLYKNFGKIQAKNNLLDDEMAKILGISEYEYIKYATGKKIPSIEILVKLKEHFNVDIDWFLFGEPQPNKQNDNPPIAINEGLETLTKDELLKLKKLLNDL